jgi:hypothetical protein
MWVDPKDSRRLINGNDGGATISYDGGDTWSSIYNQPTAQFYHVATDNQFPYRFYGAQQDNSTVSIASRSDDGQIGERDYYPVAGCENATISVDPRDPNITYGGCYTGFLSRVDHATGQQRDISVWMANYDGWPVKDVPFRFQWTFPTLISPHDALRDVAVRAQVDGRRRELDADLPGPHGARSGDVRQVRRTDSR